MSGQRVAQIPAGEAHVSVDQRPEIENLFAERRTFPPDPAFVAQKVAYHWIGEPGDTRTITYADLLREVQKTANALRELGIGTGDRVAIYMPMIPELPIAMLACARIGAPHTVVFGGFSAEALSGRS